MEENPDFLIALTHTVTRENRLIELVWCAFDVKSREVTEETSMFIKPADLDLSEERVEGVTLQDLESSQDLHSALMSFNKFICDQFILQNLNFCLITHGDILLSQILPQECSRVGIKLAPHFLKFFDLSFEFEKIYGSLAEFSIPAMLNQLGLSEYSERIQSRESVKSIIRIVNKMLKDGHTFATPLDSISERPRSKAVYHTTMPLPEKVEMSTVVLIKGADPKTEETELEEFFYALRVEKIVRVIDPYGEPTGFFYIKFYSFEDTCEALTFSRRKLRDHVLNIEESSDEAYMWALKNIDCPKDWNARPVFLKDKREGGLVYMFGDVDYYVVAAEDQSSSIDEQEFFTYIRPNLKEKSPTLTSEARARAVKVRGFKANVNKKVVIEYLRDFEVFKNQVFISQDNLQKGNAEVIVLMNTTDERERVLRTLSNKLHSGRPIDVYPFT